MTDPTSADNVQPRTWSAPPTTSNSCRTSLGDLGGLGVTRTVRRGRTRTTPPLLDVCRPQRLVLVSTQNLSIVRRRQHRRVQRRRRRLCVSASECLVRFPSVPNCYLTNQRRRPSVDSRSKRRPSQWRQRRQRCQWRHLCFVVYSVACKERFSSAD